MDTNVQPQIMNHDELMHMLLEKFKVVVPTAPRSKITQAEMRISTNRFIFNHTTAAELGYPDYVCMYISNDATQIVLCPTEKCEYSVEFCARNNEEGKASKAVYMSNKGLVQNIRDAMQWREKTTYVVPAAACLDGKALLFNLQDAFIRTKSPGVWEKASPHVMESYPSVSEVVLNFRQVALTAHISDQNEPIEAECVNVS